MIRRSPHPRQAAALPQDALPDEDASAGAGITPAEAALYIADMMVELSVIARRARLDLLAYFLEMARVEAAARARTPCEPQDD